jgi:hypothetical protein
MGQLTPDAEYIYESPDGGKTIYAREKGVHPVKRVLIGARYPTIQERLEEERMWKDILELSKTNETLRSELERVITVYHLVKDNKPPIDHHSV